MSNLEGNLENRFSHDMAHHMVLICEVKIVFELTVDLVNNVFFTDSIEANVEHAEIHVQEGTQQLSKARDYQVVYKLW